MIRSLLVTAALMYASGALAGRLPASAGAPLRLVTPVLQQAAAAAQVLGDALER